MIELKMQCGYKIRLILYPCVQIPLLNPDTWPAMNYSHNNSTREYFKYHHFIDEEPHAKKA